MVVVVMQITSLQRKLEQERKAMKSQVNDLERKLEVFRQQLVAAESTISVKTSELAALQNNLKELEELREMKEVLILFFHLYHCSNCITKNRGVNVLSLYFQFILCQYKNILAFFYYLGH